MSIAFWCVLVAIVLPYVWFTVANVLAGKQARDNELPRGFDKHLSGKALAAYNAHLNSFEGNPAFAAGVIIATLAHAPQGRVDLLAMVYVVLRLLYGAFYISGKGTLRSIAWFAGLVTVVALFVASSW